ncbi:unnamed protein product [Rotaria sp. Silwood2]|nr:unnamed protein product [Rotaria sp. Silwood2]
MKINITTFRPHQSFAMRAATGNMNAILNKLYQAATARMFNIWGEVTIANRSGHDCPYSLRVMACLLLYEITSFLRKTYDTLPKLSSLPSTGVNIRQQQQQQQRATNQTTSPPQTVVETTSSLTDKRSTNRIRMSSVVSQTSNRSSASISSEHLQHVFSPQASSATAPSVLSTIPTTIINTNPPLPGERHISFAVNKEND